MSKLTLSPDAYPTEGQSISSETTTIYRVVGLPPNQETTIMRSGEVWRVLRDLDGQSSDWEGEFSTADAALEWLQLLTPAT